MRTGAGLYGHLTPSPTPKKINNFKRLEEKKSGTILPSETLAERNSDWSGWCGESMCRVYYFRRPLTKTQAIHYGLAYPAFRDGYYRPASAPAYDQFHPDARVAANFIDNVSR